MIKNVILNLTVFLSVIPQASLAASTWHEFNVNATHDIAGTAAPFDARVSFIAAEWPDGGIGYAEKLFLEVFTLSKPGVCPTVYFDEYQIAYTDYRLVYFPVLKYENGRCWAEISSDAVMGAFRGGSYTKYSRSPISLKRGTLKTLHSMGVYYEDSKVYRVFHFSLRDILNLP